MRLYRWGIFTIIFALFVFGCGSSSPKNTLGSDSVSGDSPVASLLNRTPLASNSIESLSVDTQGSYVLVATDADNDPLVYEKISEPNHGRVERFDAHSGVYTYVPDHGFVGDDSFQYRVSDGVSSSVKTATIHVMNETVDLPLAPSSLKALSTCTGAVKLTWVDNAQNENGYEIYQDGKLVCVTGSNVTSVILKRLHAETTYTFEVRAKNASGKSEAARVLFTTNKALDIPTAPRGVEVVAKDDKSVRIRWIDTADNESAYEIYQNATLVKTIDANSKNVLIGNLHANTTYTFSIKAKNDVGQSTGVDITLTTDVSHTSPEANKVPTAKADTNRTIEVNKRITIHGVAKDSDGNIVSYKWIEDGVVLATTASFEYIPTEVGTHTLRFTVLDDKGAMATDTMEVTVTDLVDSVKPIITLLGEAHIILNVGAVYTDAGARATDDKEGDISSNIIMTGRVDTSTAGRYILHYNVQDQAQNSADEVLREVIVKMMNHLPMPTAQTVTMNQGTHQVITLSASDADGDPLTFKVIKNPRHGSVTLSGNRATYIPHVDFYGDDSFEFVANDGASDSEKATVSVRVKEHVNQSNKAPVITTFSSTKSSLFLNEKTTISYGASDPDGDTITSRIESSLDGMISHGDGGNGVISWQPKSEGTHILTMNVDDGKGATVTKTITLLVKAPDQIGFTKIEIADGMQAHNTARTDVGVNESLSWSDVIALDAQTYADEIAKSGIWDHDPKNRNGYENGPYGENLFTATYQPSLKRATQAWIAEKADYHYGKVGDSSTCNTGKVCGHYTQVIWKETLEVGCGISQYQTGAHKDWYVVVCKYKKPGNYIGHTPY